MRRELLDFLKWMAALIWRQKTWQSVMFSAGVALFLAALTGGVDFLLHAVMSSDRSAVAGTISSGEVPPLVRYAALAVGGVLMAVGAVAGFVEWRARRRLAARALVMPIEIRGLRLGNDAPLDQAEDLPRGVRREPRLVDIRSRFHDGRIVDPRGAVAHVDDRLRLIPSELLDRASEDITVVFGGLAPVPLIFLAGVHLDDEAPVHRLDWDRGAERWRALDGIDDGERFEVDERPARNGSGELVLCVSVSYPIDVEEACRRRPDAAVVDMRLRELNVDNHWSVDKQRALARQFLDVLIRHSHHRVVHLHLASQVSVAFLFGQRYDKRNLPPVLVYQYERGAVNPYPWAIQMPVAGAPRARFVPDAGEWPELGVGQRRRA